MTEDLAKKPISELNVSEFIGIMSGLMEQVDEQKRTKGEARLLELTVPEFTATMVEALKSRAFKNGLSEQELADRVLSDLRILEGVQAVTMPFRVKNVEDAHKLARTMAESFAPGFNGELVVVVAYAHASGAGQPFTHRG